MTERYRTLLWMNDILEHLNEHFERWKEADDQDASLLADSMRRDIQQFSALCESVSHDPELAC